MIIKCLHDIDECKNIWEKLSPHETIYDEWDLRYCFYKYFNHELYFYVGLIDDEIVGLLPLQYDKTRGYLEFFGDIYLDDNKVFIAEKYQHLIPEFYQNIDLPIKTVLMQDDPYTKSLPFDDYSYYFNLKNITNTEDFLQKVFNSKHRKNLNRELKSLESNQLEVLENNFKDIDLLIDLNLKRFGTESNFDSPHRPEIFKDMLKLPYHPVMLTFVVNGQKESVSLSLFHNKIYYLTVLGTNTSITGLGKYVTLKNVEKALELGAEIFDVSSGDCGWKENWHAEKISQYLFSKNIPNVANNNTTQG